MPAARSSGVLGLGTRLLIPKVSHAAEDGANAGRHRRHGTPSLRLRGHGKLQGADCERHIRYGERRALSYLPEAFEPPARLRYSLFRFPFFLYFATLLELFLCISQTLLSVLELLQDGEFARVLPQPFAAGLGAQHEGTEFNVRIWTAHLTKDLPVGFREVLGVNRLPKLTPNRRPRLTPWNGGF